MQDLPYYTFRSYARTGAARVLPGRVKSENTTARFVWL